MSGAAAEEERRKDPGGDPRARIERGGDPSGEDFSPVGPPPAQPPKKPSKVLDVRNGFALENFEKS